MTPVPGLPAPRLIHGLLPGSWNGAVLAWGETNATASLGSGMVPAGADDGSVLAAVLACPRPDPAAACRGNAKTLLVALRGELDCALPGSGIVRTPDDLSRLSQACRRIHGEHTGWVLKGDYSAAGRERVLDLSGADPGAGVLEAAGRLLRRHGACLLEPWLPRTSDFGCSLLIEEDRVRLAGVHRLLVTPGGRFRGVETALHGLTEPGAVTPERFQAYLGPQDAARMAQAAAGAALALARTGYRGHAGIDFWRYTTPSGESRLNLLGEVNARLTFGLVAAVLAQRVGAALGASENASLRLWLGPGEDTRPGQRYPLVMDAENQRAVSSLSIIPRCSADCG